MGALQPVGAPAPAAASASASPYHHRICLNRSRTPQSFQAGHQEIIISQAFASLGLLPELLRAIEEQGYTDPTPIQAQAIPVVLSGRDLLGAAQTGTGTSSGTDTSNNTSASSSALAAIVLEDGAPPVAPGDAGRWLLPDAAAPAWTAWGALLWSVHSASGLWSAYTLLQGIVLLLMIIK